jgi:hypothetical protein
MATRQFNIFVEGTDDHDLILALVHEIRAIKPHPTKANTRKGGVVTSYRELQPFGDTLIISSTGGWSKLGKNQGTFIQEARDSGGRTLVVFDADYDTDNTESAIKHESGGPVKRREAILAKLAPFDSNPDVFLFPGPAQPGDLEMLLLQLTQPKHQRVMDCYSSYEECLQQFLNSDGSFHYNAPSNKRRIYDYVNVMPLEGNEWERHHKEGGQKIFENADIWNLHAPAIQPLRNFLDHCLP